MKEDCGCSHAKPIARKPEQPAKKKLRKVNEEGLRAWFGNSKSKDGKSGWVNVVTGGTCASDEPGEGTPKCVSSSKRASMTKAQRLSASARKKSADPGQQGKSGAAKPTYVSTDKSKMNEESDKKGKGSGTKDACYTKVKSRYSVWPSAYASGALVKCRKVGAANWGNKSESINSDMVEKIVEACWKSYIQKGLKKKGNRMVPNCVPKGSVEEACWAGYEKKGMKKMFGKKYPNCVKKITEQPSFEVGGKKTTGMGGMTPGDVERLKLGNPGAVEKIDGKYKEIRRGINLPLAKKENKGTQLAHYEPKGNQIDELSLPGTGTVIAPRTIGAVTSPMVQKKVLGINVGNPTLVKTSIPSKFGPIPSYTPQQANRYNAQPNRPSTLKPDSYSTGYSSVAKPTNTSSAPKPQTASTASSAPRPTPSQALETGLKGVPILGNVARIANNMDKRNREVERQAAQYNSYEPEGTQIDEAPKTIYSVGQTYSVVLNWRTKVINIKFFFPTQQRPTKEEVQAAIDKIYPGAVLYMYTPAINDPTKPFIFANEDSVCDESVIETYINKRKKLNIAETAAWQRKEGKNPEGGLNKTGIASYRRENPGSKLSMAVTTPPSKLKPGSKSANRRKSFCARMGGVDGPMEDDKGHPTRKALALRKWNC